MGMAPAQDSGMEEEPVFEYRTYKLERVVTIDQQETKLVSLFDPHTVAVKKVFRYDGARNGQKVAINLEFMNSEKDGLGIPLPAGKVKVYKESPDGFSEFVGEDRISHTSKDEKVTLFPGFAFDLVGERTLKSSSRITDRMREESVEIVLRNHKSENADVFAVEHFGGDWEIIKKSHEFVKKDASTIEFPVTVATGDSVTVSYTVRIKS